MKWQLIIRLESKNGDMEEHVIGTEYGVRQALEILLKNKPSYCSYLIPRQQKEILEKTQDMNLVETILEKTDIDINESMLDGLLKRFPSIENIEFAVLHYCWKNKKGLYRKFAKKCTTFQAIQFSRRNDS